MRSTATAAIIAITGLLSVVPQPLLATPPEPTYQSAVVDGQTQEWNLAQDLFANLYRAGDSQKKLECRAYLRFDCQLQTLYVLVLAEPGVVAWHNTALSAATSWVATGSIGHKVVSEYSGNDGIPPDFAWVDPGYDSNAAHVRGYEASFRLTGGASTIFIHQATDDGIIQTAATVGSPLTGVPLSVACRPLATKPTTWSHIKSLYP